MKTIKQDAEIELRNLIHSIDKGPDSWPSWKAMHITLPELSIYSDDLQAMNCIEPLLESCLKGIEGNIFFCEQNDIFIICKNTPRGILQTIGQHACDLVQGKNSTPSNFKILDLTENSKEFVDHYCRRNKNITIFALPKTLPIQDRTASNNLFLQQEEEEMHSSAPNNENHPKVLLVEDDPVTRWMVRKSLQSKCEFTTAQTGNKALSLYTSYQPDIVFLDINLPDKDGYSVLEWIMQHDPGAYVVMFSSEGGLDTIRNTLQGGAKGFIAKPFQEDQLMHYIHDCPNIH